MSQTLAEILLLVSVAANVTLLIFLAGVLRKVMNDMDEPALEQFLASLYRHSARSPFMHTVLTIPLLGAIPYFYFYGFHNRWITAGLALWLVAGCIAKMIKVPVFKHIAALDSGDVARLSTERHKLNAGNMLQATLTFVAAAFMIIAFIRK